MITGDTSQVDVPGGRSGLLGLEKVLTNIDGLAWVHLTGADVVRSIEGILTRYGNAGLSDPLTRVARDPIRKLAPDGPLLGAARLVHRVTGRVPAGFARAIASALAYRNDSDAQARRLREMLERDGLAVVLRDVCGLEADDPITREVSRIYRLLTVQRVAGMSAG